MASKVAIVTGATGGLGEAIARRLAQDGIAVVLSGRRDAEGQEAARKIAEETGTETHFVRADIGQAEDCLRLVSEARTRFGRVDILVNNAAELAQSPWEELTVEQWDAAYAANVRAPWLLSRACAPLMREAGGGSIVNIGTTMNYKGGSLDRVAYSTSKGALLTLTKSLASQLIRDKIRVNYVIVGWMATPQEKELRDKTHGDGEKFLRETGEKRPLGRHETPEDIAHGVAYLVSDSASHVTACELNISGGLLI